MKHYKIDTALVRVSNKKVPRAKKYLKGLKYRVINSKRGWSMIIIQKCPSHLYFDYIAPLTRSVV